MVVSTIALGSGSPAAAASTNQRVNCLIGDSSSISGVNALFINANLSMAAACQDPAWRSLNEADSKPTASRQPADAGECA
jgi:hypothetical protein